MFALNTETSCLSTPKGTPIPLRGVDFEVTIRDIGAWVTVSQHFQNVENQPIEAVYSFPLPEGAAVGGFEVRCGERVITGRVEEKETAFAQYDEALKEGHGAYLVDQDRPNIFTISVGNLLPQQSVVIRISYVQEVDTQAHGGRFVIPTTISPRYVPLEQLQTAPASELMHINPPTVLGTLPYGLQIRVDLATSCPLQSVESPSHPIRCQFQEGHATVELVGENIQLDQDFVLNYTLQKSSIPQVLMSRDMGSDGFVAMINFWPELPTTQRQPQEFILVIDRSGSMSGESIQQAKMALLLCLKSMQPGDQFNVYGFGSSYQKLFERSQPYTPETLNTATGHAQTLDADLGGTEIYQALEDALSHRGNLPSNIILLTDGQVGNEQQVIDLAQRYRGRVRIFTFGIGRGASEYLVRGLARATGGAAEFIFPGERIEPKVMQQFTRLGLSSYAEQVHLDWGGLPVNRVTPAVLPPLFTRQRWTVYARMDRVQAAQVRLEATLATQKYTWEVTIDSAQIDETPVVPLLFARSAIRDLEEQPTASRGSQQRERKEEARTRQEAIIQLGCRYQLMSSQTSFVAIEQRQDGDKTTEIKLRRVPVALTRGWGGTTGHSRIVSRQSIGMPPSVGSNAGTVRRHYFRSLGSPFEDSNLFKADEAKLGQENRTIDPFFELIVSQNFDGSWSLCYQLAEKLGWKIAQIKKVMRALKHFSDEEAQKIIATLLAIHALKNRFPERQSEWQLLVQKAEQWLRSLSLVPPRTASEPVDVAERWQVWFARQVNT